MIEQPDFTKIFFKTFRNLDRPLRYELRHVPNLIHDLVFMSSLVHDAGIVHSDCVFTGEFLSISLQRACWERGTEQGLDSARSALQFRNFTSSNWPEITENLSSTSFIDGLAVDMVQLRTKDQFELCVVFSDIEPLRITFPECGFSVVLEDAQDTSG